MAERMWRSLATAGALALLMFGGGCADQAQKREDDLAELLAWFPGHYDNGAQVQHDVQSGVKPPHDHVALLVMPAHTPRLGHHIFYVQEMAPDNPERIMSQRMFSFDIDEKRGIIGLMYNFVEPLRWRDGVRDSRMFTSVMADDVAPVGCELIWTRSGEHFTASHDPKHCHRAGSDAATSGPEATLSADAFTLSGYEFKKSAH